MYKNNYVWQMLFTEDQEDVFQMWFFKADDKFRTLFMILIVLKRVK